MPATSPRKRRSRGPRATPPAARHGRTLFQIVAPLVIVAAGAIAYANSLHGPLIFDDYRSIIDNATIRQLSPLTVLRPPPQRPVTGRPMVNLSFALNYAAGGLAPEGYHLSNIAIHLCAALALFGVLRRTPWWIAAGGADADRLALFCALAWLLHPLNTEAVDYITQRTESMAGLMYLVTLYAAIRAWSADTRWGGRWTAIAAVACWCGVATKESMVTAPLMVLLWDRVFRSTSLRAAVRQRGVLYLALAASWMLFGVLSLDTPFFRPAGFATSVSRGTYLLNQAPLIVRYLRLGVWPTGLVLDYGMPRALTVAAVWPDVLLIAALLALTLVALVRAPSLGFWGAWFFVTLAPASSVLPIPSEVGAERRMYLPLVAVIVVVVTASVWLFRHAVIVFARGTPAPASSSARRAIGAALAMLALATLTAATLRRNEEYRSGVSIWQTVVARYPHARAHENLAAQLRDAGRIDEAVEHLRIAAPDLPDARHVLGSILLDRGDVRGAVRELQAYVTENPRDPQIVSGREELASALLREGDRGGAIAEFRAIVAKAPQDARARLNLGNLLLGANDPEGAAAQYRECLRLQPDNADAAAQLGAVFVGSGRGTEALAMYRRASILQPANETWRHVIIGLLLNRQQFAEAEAAARAAVASRPGDGDAHNLLGVALAFQQRLDAAIQEFELAARINPQSTETRNNLARALAVQKRSQTGRPGRR
jgi:Flp pilus assembly protein TadD